MKVLEFDDLKKLKELGILMTEESARLSDDRQKLVVLNPMSNTTRFIEIRQVPFKLKSTREVLHD